MKRGVNPKICWSKFLPYQTILHTIQGHLYLGEKIRQLIVATTFTCQAFCWGSTHTLIVPKLFLSPHDVYTTWKWWILISKLLTINVVFVYFQNIYKQARQIEQESGTLMQVLGWGQAEQHCVLCVHLASCLYCTVFPLIPTQSSLVVFIYCCRLCCYYARMPQ